MALSDYNWIDVAEVIQPRRRFTVIEAGAMLTWMGFIMVPTFMLASEQHGRLLAWKAHAVAPSFWSMSVTGWHWVPLGLACFAGPLVVARMRDWADRAVWLLMVFTLSLVWNVLMVRSYYVIERGEVRIRPMLPWQAVTRFSLAGATVTERGCHHVFGRHSSDTLIFRVRYGTGRLDNINLGQAVGSGNAGEWLKAIGVYQTTITPASAAGVPHDPRCIDKISRHLDDRQRAVLHGLID